MYISLDRTVGRSQLGRKGDWGAVESFRSSSRPPKCTSHLGIGLGGHIDAQDTVVDSLSETIQAEVKAIELLGGGINDLNSRMDGFDTKLELLGGGINDLNSRMDGFDTKIDGIRDDIGLVRGGHARNAMRQNLARIAEHFGFRLISPVPQATVIAFSMAAAGQGEASNEVASFGNADMVMNILDAAGKPAYVALEASFTVDANDIRRAVRNAGYLKALTGLPTYAAVAGVQVLPDAQAAVEAGRVLLYEIAARELQSE